MDNELTHTISEVILDPLLTDLSMDGNFCFCSEDTHTQLFVNIKNYTKTIYDLGFNLNTKKDALVEIIANKFKDIKITFQVPFSKVIQLSSDEAVILTKYGGVCFSKNITITNMGSVRPCTTSDATNSVSTIWIYSDYGTNNMFMTSSYRSNHHMIFSEDITRVLRDKAELIPHLI